MSEAVLQTAIVRTLRLALPHGFLVVAVPNNPRNRISGAIQKGMGMMAGFPDCIVLGALVSDDDELRPFTGFMEIKTAKGRLSEEQRACHDKLSASGFRVAVVRSIEEALVAARSWGLPLRIRE